MVYKAYNLIIELIKLNYWPKLFDFIRCSWKHNVNDIYNIKVVFWMQPIYFDNCLGPKRAFDCKNDCVHHLDINWIPFFIQMSQFCFYSKNGVGVQNDSSWKPATTIWLKGCGRVVLTISEVKLFLAGKLCQVNFQKFSSLTNYGFQLQTTLIVIRLLQRTVKPGFTPLSNGNFQGSAKVRVYC